MIDKRKNLRTNFQETHVHGSNFLAKLEKVKLENKSVHSKTKINTQKVEWIKQNIEYNKLQKKLELDMNEFMEENATKSLGEELIPLDLQLKKQADLMKKTLIYEISGLKSLVTDCVTLGKQFKQNPKKMKERYIKRIKDVQEIRSSIVSILQSIKNDTELHYLATSKEVQEHKENILFGDISDNVKGFDKEIIPPTTEVFESIKQYTPILGQLEISKIIYNYQRYLTMAEEIADIELLRVKQKMPLNIIAESAKWTDDEQFRFKLIYREFILGGKGREKYMQRLSLEFESHSQNEIQEFSNILELTRWQKSKIKAIYRDLDREKFSIYQKVINLVKKDVQTQRIKIEENLKKLYHSEECEKSHQIHTEKLKLYEEKVVILREIEERERCVVEEENIKRSSKEQEHVKEVKMKASNYKQQKIEIEKKTRINKEMEESKIREEVKEQVKENKPKVAKREDIEKRKLKKKLEMDKESEMKKQEKDILLLQAIENYKFRPKMEADTERLNQPTECRIIRQTTNLDKGDQVNLFKNYGYTADKLMGDLRYKLSTVLNEAGVGGTSYARELMKGVGTNLAPRQDMIGTIKALQ